jgi:phospholipid/cholesterol/gamma-HCH transport system substrate-binding protein
VTVSRRTISATAKLSVFTVVSLLCTGTLVAIMGSFGFGDTVQYTAIFSNASMLQKGDEVRAAGIVMGQVEEVERYDPNRAKVTLEVRKSLPITTDSRVEIRYLDLVGARYVAVQRGRPGAPRLEEDATIPITHTTPALDLTALYNGFAPLFSALRPEDVNELSENLVQVLQGEGGTVEQLLDHAASVSSAIADRDELVGEVLDNLNGTLATLDERHGQLIDLVRGLRRWMGQLSRDRTQIGSSVANLSSMADNLADLLVDGRPVIKQDVAELRILAHTLSTPKSQVILNAILDRLPESFEDQTRTGTYGSWYNYYLCGVQVQFELPDALRDVPELQPLVHQLTDFGYNSTAPRCD